MENFSNSDYLFVYGTLRSDSDNRLSRMLQSYSKKVGEAYFYGRLFDSGRFPAAVRSSNNADKVYGELLEINEPVRIFPKIDRYEGFNPDKPKQSLFVRKKHNVYLDDDQKVTAWIYLFNKSISSFTEIASGDYLTYLSESPS